MHVSCLVTHFYTVTCLMVTCSIYYYKTTIKLHTSESLTTTLVLFWGFKVDGETLPSGGGHVRIALFQLSLGIGGKKNSLHLALHH